MQMDRTCGRQGRDRYFRFSYTFWLLFYNTDQPARHNKDPKPESRVMQVWFDNIVIATEYIGPIQDRTEGGRKKKPTISKTPLNTGKQDALR